MRVAMSVTATIHTDPIAALAEAWGCEMDEIHITDTVENVLPITRAADAKRARRAAKRAEDERRTAEGRATTFTLPAKLGWRRHRWADGTLSYEMAAGFWDAVASRFDGWPDYEAPLPRWKRRARERRALPGMERPWWAQPSAQARGPVAGWSRGLVRRHVAATHFVWWANWRGAL